MDSNSIKEITSGIEVSKGKLDVRIMNQYGIVAQAEFANDLSRAKKAFGFSLKTNAMMLPLSQRVHTGTEFTITLLNMASA